MILYAVKNMDRDICSDIVQLSKLSSGYRIKLDTSKI